MQEVSVNNIVQQLNQKASISTIVIDQLNMFDLSEEEKAFILQYRPQNSLIIYGTLAPGKPNHKIIEHIKGEWIPSTIKGKLENKGWGAEMGFFGFKHASPVEASIIDCWVLLSDELVDNWKMLDEFEGPGYKRVLAEYTLQDNKNGVGYIYAINEK